MSLAIYPEWTPARALTWQRLRALELARAGSEVILAARSEAKGRDAVERIRRELPSAKVHFETLDLGESAIRAGICRECQS